MNTQHLHDSSLLKHVESILLKQFFIFFFHLTLHHPKLFIFLFNFSDFLMEKIVFIFQLFHFFKNLFYLHVILCILLDQLQLVHEIDLNLLLKFQYPIDELLLYLVPHYDEEGQLDDIRDAVTIHQDLSEGSPNLEILYFIQIFFNVSQITDMFVRFVDERTEERRVNLVEK